MKKLLLWVVAAMAFAGCAVVKEPSVKVNDEAFSNLQIQAEKIFETFKPARCPVDSNVIRVKECAIYVDRLTEIHATVRQVVSAVSYTVPTLGIEISVVCNYQLDGTGFLWISGTTSGSLVDSSENTVSPLQNGLSEDGTRLCPSTTP